MTRFFAPRALLADGWQRNVLINVDAQGMITATAANSTPEGAQRLNGVVLPAMANLHSHAFSGRWPGWLK